MNELTVLEILSLNVPGVVL